MAGLSQHQSLSQSQVLAPQLQQSLQILQVPMLELRTLIQVELDGNPTLEMEDNDPNESKVEDKQRDAEEFDVEFDRLSKLDDEWRDYMAQSTNYVRRSTEDDERRQFFLIRSRKTRRFRSTCSISSAARSCRRKTCSSASCSSGTRTTPVSSP